MENPLVSVIVAAYNAEQHISEALFSVERQSYKNIEIIVVDDGSTDSTPAIIQHSFPNIHYVRQDNSGSCASPRNKGLGLAKGELVTFFDADDIMLPQKIRQQVDQFERHPEAALVVSNYRNFTDTEKSDDHFSSCPEIRARLKTKNNQPFVLGPKESRTILIDENFTIASSPLFKRELVLEEKGFDTTLTACEDFHLIYRVAMKGAVVVTPEVSFERRLHDLNMSGDTERMMTNFIVSRSGLAAKETDPALANKLRKRVRHMKRELQTYLIRRGKLSPAMGMYSQTFPPLNLRELRHDMLQGTKLCLTGLKLRKVEWPH